MTNKIEKLEFDREETKLVLNELTTTLQQLDRIKDNFILKQISTDNLNIFIKRIEKEYEFNETILQEIDNGIKFIDERVD